MTLRDAPSAVEAERAYLGAVLIDCAILPECPPLQVLDFQIVRNQWVMSAITELAAEGQVVDVITVLNRLDHMGRLKELGGMPYLVELLGAPSNSQNAPAYARVVGETAMRRRMITEATAIASSAYKGDQPAADAVRHAAALQALATATAPALVGSAAAAAAEAYDAIAAYVTSGNLPGVTTGYPGLDRKTWGLRRGELTILAGRPGMGKTSLAAQMSVKQGRTLRVGVASLEEKQATWLEAAALAELGLNKMKLGAVDLARLLERMEEYAGLPLRFYDDGFCTLTTLAGAVRQMARELGGLDVLWLDHLGYVDHLAGDKRNNLPYMIGQTTKGLAKLAKELNCALVALCQLNRESARSGSEPQLTDLRDSGEIEQDARAVWFIHRPGYYTDPEAPPDKPEATWLNVAKNSSGPTGRFNLAFVRAYRQFAEWQGGIPR